VPSRLILYNSAGNCHSERSEESAFGRPRSRFLGLEKHRPSE
jgi:hypothetical protein